MCEYICIYGRSRLIVEATFYRRSKSSEIIHLHYPSGIPSALPIPISAIYCLKRPLTSRLYTIKQIRHARGRSIEESRKGIVDRPNDSAQNPYKHSPDYNSIYLADIVMDSTIFFSMSSYFFLYPKTPMAIHTKEEMNSAN